MGPKQWQNKQSRSRVGVRVHTKSSKPQTSFTHNSSLGLTSSSIKKSHSSGLQNQRVTLPRSQTHHVRLAEVLASDTTCPIRAWFSACRAGTPGLESSGKLLQAHLILFFPAPATLEPSGPVRECHRPHCAGFSEHHSPTHQIPTEKLP